MSSTQILPTAGTPAIAATPTNGALAEQAPGGVSASAPLPVASVAADTAPAESASPSMPATRLNIVVITDPSLCDDEEMRKQCPKDTPELVFPLDLDENLVGRRSDDGKIFPEIDLNDPGVSHRQLKILRQPDGSFAVLELGSKNGTTLNGASLKPGLIAPLAAGDELVLGAWTRLQLRRR